MSFLRLPLLARERIEIQETRGRRVAIPAMPAVRGRRRVPAPEAQSTAAPSLCRGPMSSRNLHWQGSAGGSVAACELSHSLPRINRCCISNTPSTLLRTALALASDSPCRSRATCSSEARRRWYCLARKRVAGGDGWEEKQRLQEKARRRRI